MEQERALALFAVVGFSFLVFSYSIRNSIVSEEEISHRHLLGLCDLLCFTKNRNTDDANDTDLNFLYCFVFCKNLWHFF
jgi:hypothetical protein